MTQDPVLYLAIKLIVASTFLVKIKITFFKDNRLVYRDGYQKSKLFITNALEFIRLISAITKLWRTVVVSPRFYYDKEAAMRLCRLCCPMKNEIVAYKN